jgi:hypothetical protein
VKHTCWLFALLLLAPGVAHAVQANGAGPRVGFSSNPDQLVLGGQVELGEIAPDIDFTPNAELGFGDHATVIALNFDLHYRFRISGSPWSPYAGAGLGVNFIQVDLPAPFEDDSNTEVGGNVIVGAQVPTQAGSRFFTELKLGLGDIPDFKLLVGWNFKL